MPSRLRALLLLLLVELPFASHGQTDSTAAFKPLLRRFYKERYANALRKPAEFPLPIVYQDSTYGPDKRRQLNFELRLAAQPLGLQRHVLKLAAHGYPVAYSVVVQNCLVALFKNGRFGCYRLTDFTPDERLERQLNIGGWERCWLLDGLLVAQNSQGYFAYDAAGHGWRRYEQRVPFGRQPKLYEDAHYLAYADCNGEFGGNVYFYNKQTEQTHRANATCANSIWRENGEYRLLVSLGHMMGSAACAAIANPELLARSATSKTKGENWQYSSAKPEQGVSRLFDWYGLQLFGAWRWQGQTLYLMHWRETTFLVTINGKQITIVDPLFADKLYTHNPVTITYGPDLALTNLDFDGLSSGGEVATLVWQGRQVTKIEWGEQP